MIVIMFMSIIEKNSCARFLCCEESSRLLVWESYICISVKLLKWQSILSILSVPKFVFANS